MHNIPKGQNLTQRTLEHFHFWGCVDEVRAQRLLPPEVPAAGIVAYRSLMSDHWHDFQGREILDDYYFQKNDRLPQYRFEAVLRRRMASLPLVDTRFGWAAQDVAQDETSVRVRVVHEAGNGADELLEADYVVGCDGAHSVVRERAGIQRDGTDFDQLMVLAVFCSREFSEGLKRFPMRSTYRVMDPALNGYWQFFGRIDPKRASSSMRRCLPTRRATATISPVCCTRSRVSSFRAASNMSASGTCASRSRKNTAPGTSSSPGTPRIPIRPMVASASTTGSKMRPIWHGSWRRVSTVGPVTGCLIPTIAAARI